MTVAAIPRTWCLGRAREIQANLPPAGSTQGPPLTGINVPAREVSGDFYDFFELSDGRIGFGIGDVAGKGMNAALLMAKTSSLLHCLGKRITGPAELLARVNDEVCESATRGMFVTVVTGIFDPRAGTLCFVNAGHQPPLHRRPDGRFEEIRPSAPPLGVTLGTSYETIERGMQGGSLYLVTDGVTEAIGPNGRPLGVSGLEAIHSCAALPASERLKRIIGAINLGRQVLTDDMTLLIIEAQMS